MRRASIALLLSALPCFAESPAPLDLEQRPAIDVPRLPRPPTLEDFLGMQPPPDLAPHVVRLQGFVQQVPEDGLPASQLTDVFLGHDADNLYVVFVAWDEEPQRIRAHVTRREQVFSDETVEIQIDTFDGGQRAYSFLTNPFGIQWDAIWTEGQGFDESWDTVWDSRGQLTEQGYVVWMAIPFKSLRFRPSPDGVPQSWRFILVRDIPRNNETSFWPRVSSRIEGRLNQAATARGFDGVSPGRNVWLIPYAAGAAQDLRPAPGEPAERSEEGDVGLDAKWVIRDRLALDATVNPNFAQVESDEAQVTINQRFEVFFPERRPFFLENADYFRTPIDLLFTRRIVDPGLGARLTGQVGSYRVGALVVDDELPGKLAEPGTALDGERAWNGIARASRDLPNQSSVGFLVTDRELGDSYNRVAGVDTRIKLDRNWETQIQAAYASTRTVDAAGTESEPASDLDGAAFTGMVNRFGRKLRTHLHYLDIGREFRTELGFVPRTDIRDGHAEVAYDFRPSGRQLVRVTPLALVQRIENHDGLRLDEVVRPELEFEFRRQTSFGIGGEVGRVQLLRCEDYVDPSCSTPGAPPASPESLDFEIDAVAASFETSFVRSVDFDARYEVGRSFNLSPPAGELPGPADRAGLEVGLTLRLGRHVRVDSAYLRTELDDPADAGRILTDQIVRTRFEWQVGRRLSVRTIVRHDDTDPHPTLSSAAPRNEVNGDLLVTYLVNPWTALYVGANSNRTSTAHDPLGEPVFVDDPFNDANVAFLKISYLFRP
jgi:hypothetical protein